MAYLFIVFIIIFICGPNMLRLTISAPTKKHTYSCDDVRNTKCLIRFNANLGIPTGIGAKLFLLYIEDYFKENGLDFGFVGICGAVNLLKVCEGDDFSDCLSVKGFENQGANKADAAAFASYAGVLAYVCGNGYSVLYNALPCIEKTYANSVYKRQCYSAFGEEVSRDTKNACAYYQKYAECLSKAIVNNCGNSTGQAYCNAVTNGYKYLDNTCTNLECKYLK